MANCRYCGSPLYDNMKFCGNCGQLVIKEELQEELQAQADNAAPAQLPPQPPFQAPPAGQTQLPPSGNPSNPYGPRLTGESSQYAVGGASPAVGTAAWQMENNAAAGPASAPVSKGTDGMGIVSLILGIISILSSCCCLRFAFVASLITGIAAVVLAFVAKSKAPDRKFSGVALGGLITGIIGVLFGIVAMILSMFASMIGKTLIEKTDDGELADKLKELLEKLGISVNETTPEG
ncbi:MAG: hypothetical protein IKI42_10580 [Clostridia bacterium]|nr:hypothetical protein [Clostridia bacterium]